MSAAVKGRISWDVDRDQEGHREYKIKWLVRTTSVNDGPATVLSASGLPLVGSTWAFGNEIDPWAFCWPNMKVAMSSQYRNEPGVIWIVEQLFTTKPLSRCQDATIEDPLLEPQKVSGSFVKYTKEITKDRNDAAVRTSSFELLRGPLVEFDHNKPTVRIEQNVAQLNLATFSQLIDHVNSGAMWGVSTRRVKLSNCNWERKLQGLCNYYYVRSFEFDIDFNGFDRKALDEGTKCLAGDWNSDGHWKLRSIDGAEPDPDNPAHFVRYKDRNGENARVLLRDGLPLGATVVDALGTSSTTVSSTPDEVDIEYYEESDLLTLLNLPTSF